MVTQMDTILITPKDTFFRARKGRYFRKVSEVKAPPNHKAGNGRLNPQGVSYLYVSESISTTFHEVNACGHTPITVIRCQPRKTLRILNLVASDKEKDNIHSFKRIIDRELSKPYTKIDNQIGYKPTQAIALFIRDHLKLDGVRYSCSKDMTKQNILIFNPNQCNYELINKIFRVN